MADGPPGLPGGLWGLGWGGGAWGGVGWDGGPPVSRGGSLKTKVVGVVEEMEMWKYGTAMDRYTADWKDKKQPYTHTPFHKAVI